VSQTQLSGKVAIITGSGSGIGRAIAILLVESGVKVVICGRRYELLQKTADFINSQGGEALAVQANVSILEEVRHLVGATKERFGKINILVNNAGIAVAKPFLEMEESEWDLTIDTNLKSIFITCKEVIPEMLESGQGVIVNISSILGKTGIANFSAYSASKFGVIGLTQAVAKEYQSNQIRVYAVCPGRTSTDMQKRLGGNLIASMSMPPEMVANKVIQIINGNTMTKSGGDVVINNQSLRLKFYETSKGLSRAKNKFKAFLFDAKRYFSQPK